jgi:hypothetical protein
MAAITNPGTKVTEFSGEYKLLSMYNLAIASASDTLTLTFAENHVASIQNVLVCCNTGQDAAFTEVAVSFSNLTITITSVEQDGTASTAWTDTTVNLLAIVK